MPDTALNVLFLVRKINCNDGIASYCTIVSSGLRQLGTHVILVSGHVFDKDSASTAYAELASSVAVWKIFEYTTSFPSISELMALRKLIKRHNIRIINVHGLGMLAWGRVLALVSGLPLVASYHPSAPGHTKDSNISFQKFSTIQRIYLYLLAPDRLIVLSQKSKSDISQQSAVLAGRIEMISGGVDIDRYRPPQPAERARSRQHFGIEEQDIVCVLIGRLTWNKGHDLVVAAVRRVRAMRPDLAIRCLFVGAGEHEDEIRRFTHHDADDEKQFRFLGYVADIREVLWASDVFVLPSRLEGFALVIPEAMATGVVPIRTPSGGASDQIVSGETGYIVPFEDIEAIIDAMLRLGDPQLRREMAKNCVARARAKFSRDTMAERINSLYRTLAGC